MQGEVRMKVFKIFFSSKQKNGKGDQKNNGKESNASEPNSLNMNDLANGLKNKPQ
jgi:hypothetical protein